ncbi:MAG: hypothetical protein ACXVXP_00270 [Mycobacteriaceae bacterium]
MSIKPIDCFTIVCDWPGCGADVMEDADYSGWGDVDYLLETTSDSGWWTSTTAMSHFCNEHPAIWASDLEDGALPSRPYLLIHDGDTDNRDDDGKVTLVRPVTETLLMEGNLPLPEVCS